jgi:hypothetical protein
LLRSSTAGASFAALGAGDELKQRAVAAVLFATGYDGGSPANSFAVIATQGSGFWRSSDGGLTFHPVSETKLTSNLIRAIARAPGGNESLVDPKTPQALAAGSLLVATADEGVFQSNDNGVNYANISTGLPAGALTPVQAIMIPSGAPATAIAAVPGQGLWRYNGTAWSQLASATAGSITGFVEGSGAIHAARSDGNSLRSTDNGLTWTAPDTVQTDLVKLDYNATSAPALSAGGEKAAIGPATASFTSANTAALWAVSASAGPRYSTDSGASWIASPGGGDYILPDGVIYSTVNTLGIDPVTGGRVVLVGTTTGLWRSDDGGTSWRNVSGPGSGLEATSLNFSALLSTATAYGTTDVLTGATGATTGGVYLSGDAGLHWTQVNAGFDPNNLSISSLVQTACSGCPVQYYSGSYGGGLYTRTIAVAAPPAFPGVNYACFGATGCTCGTGTLSGPEQGGQAFKLCGSNFQSGLVVEFDGVAASGCTQSGGTVITCTGTPPHAPGSAKIRVRNPDTRAGGLPGLYSYVSGTQRTSNFRVAKAGSNAALSWSCTGCTAANPARIYRSQNAAFTLNLESYNGGTGGSYSNSGALSASANPGYFWSVE